MLRGQKIVLGITVVGMIGIIIYSYTRVEEKLPNCPDGEVTITIPADASSAEVKKIADETITKYAGCRTTIILEPRRDSYDPQKTNFTSPLPLLP